MTAPDVPLADTADDAGSGWVARGSRRASDLLLPGGSPTLQGRLQAAAQHQGGQLQHLLQAAAEAAGHLAHQAPPHPPHHSHHSIQPSSPTSSQRRPGREDKAAAGQPPAPPSRPQQARRRSTGMLGGHLGLPQGSTLRLASPSSSIGSSMSRQQQEDEAHLPPEFRRQARQAARHRHLPQQQRDSVASYTKAASVTSATSPGGRAAAAAASGCGPEADAGGGRSLREGAGGEGPGGGARGAAARWLAGFGAGLEGAALRGFADPRVERCFALFQADRCASRDAAAALLALGLAAAVFAEGVLLLQPQPPEGGGGGAGGAALQGGRGGGVLGGQLVLLWLHMLMALPFLPLAADRQLFRAHRDAALLASRAALAALALGMAAGRLRAPAAWAAALRSPRAYLGARALLLPLLLRASLVPELLAAVGQAAVDAVVLSKAGGLGTRVAWGAAAAAGALALLLVYLCEWRVGAGGGLESSSLIAERATSTCSKGIVHAAAAAKSTPSGPARGIRGAASPPRPAPLCRCGRPSWRP
jgi:hypothetical protein